MFRSCAAAVAAALFCSTTFATPLVIQPDESASKDVMIYQFMSTSNLNSSFPTILATGKTDIGHDFAALIQFDLPNGSSIGVGEQATLNLFVRSPATSIGFGAGPSAAYPATVDLYRITDDWSESAVTWGSIPAYDSTLAATSQLTGIDQYISIDVTSLVQGWINDPSTNHGIIMFQRNKLVDDQAEIVAAVYDSASAANRPYLQIAAVPEPTALSLLGLAAVFGLRRIRRA
jgi:hypothetical protein